MKLERVYGHLWRGSYPTNPEDFAAMKAAGITTVISLQGNLRERLDDEVVSEMDSFQGTFHWVPLSSFFPPSKVQIDRIMQLIDSSTQGVLVHCEQGVDRTGFVVAVHLMRKLGIAFLAAAADMVNHGMHWWYAPWLVQLWRVK